MCGENKSNNWKTSENEEDKKSRAHKKRKKEKNILSNFIIASNSILAFEALTLHTQSYNFKWLRRRILRFWDSFCAMWYEREKS